MWPTEMKVVLHENASGVSTATQPLTIVMATVRLQDAPYDERWGAYYAETAESQAARGGLQMYEVWIPHPNWPDIATVDTPPQAPVQ